MARKNNDGWGAAVVGALETFAAYLRTEGLVPAAVESAIGTETSSRMAMYIQLNWDADGDAARERLEKLPSRWEMPGLSATALEPHMYVSLEMDDQLVAAQAYDAGMRNEMMRVVLAAALMQMLPRRALVCANVAITRIHGRTALYMDTAYGAGT